MRKSSLFIGLMLIDGLFYVKSQTVSKYPLIALFVLKIDLFVLIDLLGV